MFFKPCLKFTKIGHDLSFQSQASNRPCKLLRLHGININTNQLLPTTTTMSISANTCSADGPIPFTNPSLTMPPSPIPQNPLFDPLHIKFHLTNLRGLGTAKPLLNNHRSGLTNTPHTASKLMQILIHLVRSTTPRTHLQKRGEFRLLQTHSNAIHVLLHLVGLIRV
ncbi:hypothetical protein V8G54_008714 [Vigna mungo]|uniref:Uncharacterized protein n=1 Tax=Vigna mungo TaxID=3915 RepID=A0AAQ3S8G9_VIGMU